MESTGKYWIPVELDQKLDKMVTLYNASVSLLCTIPGADKASASPSSLKLILICLILPTQSG